MLLRTWFIVLFHVVSTSTAKVLVLAQASLVVTVAHGCADCPVAPALLDVEVGSLDVASR
ncbi:hypothetical protein KC19_VG079500 [Ceratodon purpureus]|uniref:Secreted protein n=1 Tax=Ceratodon purpureus TaxID=3225 RepID=A0A8T0HN62_CERPU|nr:hypothetical protein KC19_VG079500 [Ceratodon purpureus]